MCKYSDRIYESRSKIGSNCKIFPRPSSRRGGSWPAANSPNRRWHRRFPNTPPVCRRRHGGGEAIKALRGGEPRGWAEGRCGPGARVHSTSSRARRCDAGAARFPGTFFFEVTERFSDIASNNAPLLYCEKATDEGVYMGSKDMRRRYLLRMCPDCNKAFFML